jgi:hypothetical protein
MNTLALSLFGEPWVGIAILSVVVVVLCFTSNSFRQIRAQRRDQRLRERQRQQFWGYE